MQLQNLLFVLSSHSQMGNLTNRTTGWYLPELAHPYTMLSPYYNITIASPAGGVAPLDPTSITESLLDPTAQIFLHTQSQVWSTTSILSNFVGKAADYEAIFYVGGHGPMFDLATDKISQKIIREFHDAGKLISAVCHGPAALLDVQLADGSFLLEGATVTGFSNAEERDVHLDHVVPFLLETALQERSGGHYVRALLDFESKVVVSGENGKLITGQNPGSAHAVGKAILKALGQEL